MIGLQWPRAGVRPDGERRRPGGRERAHRPEQCLGAVEVSAADRARAAHQPRRHRDVRRVIAEQQDDKPRRPAREQRGKGQPAAVGPEVDVGDQHVRVERVERVKGLGLAAAAAGRDAGPQQGARRSDPPGAVGHDDEHALPVPDPAARLGHADPQPTLAHALANPHHVASARPPPGIFGGCADGEPCALGSAEQRHGRCGMELGASPPRDAAPCTRALSPG